MYRVAIIVNENEMLHSVYANAELIFKKALSSAYRDKVDDLYSFEVFDKFNIKHLFGEDQSNLFTFDSMIIATNACNNKEIYDELVQNKNNISNYIDDSAGNYHGLFILNQQKLGGFRENTEYIGFLSDLFSYKLVRRPENSSADGNVTINADYDLIVNFPNAIDNEIIARCCCGDKNQFMPHKYRFIIEPQTPSSYETIYEDKSYTMDEGRPRQLVLKSRIANERVVISSVILDWAEHLEQLANIIIFVTEGIKQFAFIDKSSVHNKRFSRYIKKARDYKIALKEYDETNIDAVFDGLTNEEKQLYPHSVFVFSNDWIEEEVQALWNKYANQLNKDLVFYRLINNAVSTDRELALVCSFSKSITNSHMFLSAEEWLSANYLTAGWRKSIWTYEYVLCLYEHLLYKKVGYIDPIYSELLEHNKIKSGTPADLDFTKLRDENIFKNLEYQSYDNVFNSTCACCNVFGKMYTIAQRNAKISIRHEGSENNISELIEARNRCGNWIAYKLNYPDYRNKISWQDRLMAFVALYDSGYFSFVKEKNLDLYNLLVEEMKESNSELAKIIITVNRVDYRIDSSASVADLSKVLRYIYVVNKMIPDTILAEKYVSEIERYLSSIQEYNGEWKNLSETAEMSIALSLRINYSWNYKCTSIYESIINRSVNHLQNCFDYSKSCWLDDENTTAKALYAILLYDQIFNFTFDDFLVNLIDSTDRINPVLNATSNLNALDHAQENYNRLLYKKERVDNELQQLKKGNNNNEKLIKNYKLIIAFTSLMAGVSILFSVYVVGIIASSHPEVWQEILSNNTRLVMATILGLVVTSILTGIAVYAKSKLIEGFEDEGKR